MMSDLLKNISDNLQEGNLDEVKALVQKAINENVKAEVILEDGLLAGMGILGGKFKNGEVYIPDVLMAAKAMNEASALLKPLIDVGSSRAKGKVVLGTVKGDVHDIGKNIVRMMMEGKGLEVTDIGIDVPAHKFIDKAKEMGADIIACSALLTTTMPELKIIVDAVGKAGIREQVKIMIGGAPVTDAFCKQIGADIYTPDATSAAEAAANVCLVK